MKKLFVFIIIVIFLPVLFHWFSEFADWFYNLLIKFYLFFNLSVSGANTSAGITSFLLTFSILYLIGPFSDFCYFLEQKFNKNTSKSID